VLHSLQEHIQGFMHVRRSTEDQSRVYKIKVGQFIVNNATYRVISASTEVMRINSKSTRIKDGSQSTKRHFSVHRSTCTEVISVNKNTENQFTVHHWTSFRPSQKYSGSFLSTKIRKVDSQSTTERHFTVHRNTENQEYRRSIQTPLQNVISASSEGVRMEPQEKKSH
jgi:hypothetical protein